jgi:hypothetical protein
MSFAVSTADSTPDFACCTTSLVTRLTRFATDFARFAILLAALPIALLPGMVRFFVRFFAGDLRAEDLRAEDLRAPFFAAFRAGRFALDFLALLLRALFFPREPPREADLRAGDWRPAFLPRDDFLAAIFWSSDVGVLLRHYSNFCAQKKQHFAQVN